MHGSKGQTLPAGWEAVSLLYLVTFLQLYIIYNNVFVIRLAKLGHKTFVFILKLSCLVTFYKGIYFCLNILSLCIKIAIFVQCHVSTCTYRSWPIFHTQCFVNTLNQEDELQVLIQNHGKEFYSTGPYPKPRSCTVSITQSWLIATYIPQCIKIVLAIISYVQFCSWTIYLHNTFINLLSVYLLLKNLVVNFNLLHISDVIFVVHSQLDLLSFLTLLSCYLRYPCPLTKHRHV